MLSHATRVMAPSPSSVLTDVSVARAAVAVCPGEGQGRAQLC
jgi:hypothetical protein